MKQAVVPLTERKEDVLLPSISSMWQSLVTMLEAHSMINELTMGWFWQFPNGSGCIEVPTGTLEGNLAASSTASLARISREAGIPAGILASICTAGEILW